MELGSICQIDVPGCTFCSRVLSLIGKAFKYQAILFSQPINLEKPFSNTFLGKTFSFANECDFAGAEGVSV